MNDAVPVIAPDIGANGPIVVGQWLVAIGEPVSEGNRLIELLADGVLWYVASPATGHVAELHTKSRQTVSPSQTLGTIDVTNRSP